MTLKLLKTRAVQRPLLISALMATTAGCATLARSTYPAPDWQGEAPGLEAPVKAYLDPLGVPHIFAKNDDDAAVALGFFHGRDRRFQLELIRLAAQGRLTEVLGQDMLQVDRRLRLLTYRLDELVTNLDEADRRRVEAYCRGVNLAWTKTPRPLELKLLGYYPAPWTTKDVLAVARLQAWDLSADADLEAVRDRLAVTVPPETLSWLLTPSPHLGVPIVGAEGTAAARPKLPPVPAPPDATALELASGDVVPDGTRPGGSDRKAATGGPARMAQASSSSGPLPERLPAEDRAEIAEAVRRWLEEGLGGSNGWAVAPGRTSDGKALLAGDPHLDMAWPPVFYEAHIHTPEIDVSGATFPGLPMVVIGRSEGVAWTLTTSYADAQDLFTLAVDANDPMKYRLDGELVDFEAWPQTFKWGDKPDESSSETFRVSRFGPVYNAGREDRLRPDVTYALSWYGFEAGPLPLVTGFDRLYRAGTPAAAIEAIEMLPIPSQNWIFATADNRIGYVLGGRLPARRASPLPRDGSTSASAWTGSISSAERPKLIDPPSGYIVASNQPVMADVSTFNTYGSGAWRSLRITQALEARSDWNAGLSRGLQVDTVNLEAARNVPLLLQAAATAGLGEAPADRRDRVKEMVKALEGWHFHMGTGLTAPLIYESWRGHLHQRVIGARVPDPKLVEKVLSERLSEAAMETLFNDLDSPWWNDPATPEVETAATVMVRALFDAEAELTATWGPSVGWWSWGKAHTMDLSHAFAKKWYLRPLFGVDPIATPGGRHTIFALNHLGVLGDYKVESGPAIRLVVQPGHIAGFVLSGGNAGQPRHPNAHNQLDDWLEGRQHVTMVSEEAAKAQAVGTYEFKPTPN